MKNLKILKSGKTAQNLWQLMISYGKLGNITYDNLS